MVVAQNKDVSVVAKMDAVLVVVAIFAVVAVLMEDVVKNRVRGQEMIISRDDSPVSIILIPTNEELMIARDTLQIVKGMPL